MDWKKGMTAAAWVIFTAVYGLEAQQQSVDEVAVLSKKLEALLRHTNNNYVDSVKMEKLVDDAITAVLHELDPHSSYIPKDEVNATNEPLVGNFEGVGIQFSIVSDTIMVVAAIPSGPSERLGIMAGDKIIKINDSTVTNIGVTNKDVVSKLRGPKGTKVKVTIHRRSSKKPLDFEITRDKIPIFSVDAAYMATPEIGYIKLNKFAATTMDEYRVAMDTLLKQGMKDLVLDLRGNTGGYLQTAIDLSDEFLDNRKLIVYTEGTHFPKDEKYATPRGAFEKGRLVLLIDNGSASASEIVSGAVQDWDRGMIVGRRSFGKGLVQKPYGLGDGSIVRLTVQRYHTPTGRCIQKPYEEYKNDYISRLERGELFSADSMRKMPDSLTYYTPKERVVYGGGGIIPDVFVPLDTSMNSGYYSDLIRKGLFYNFSVSWVDNNRKSLKSAYPDFASFKANFNVEEKALGDFIKYAEKEGVTKVDADYETSKTQIQNLLKANIARNLWRMNEFFEIYNQINPDFLKAVSVLQDGTYEKLDLAKN